MTLLEPRERCRRLIDATASSYEPSRAQRAHVKWAVEHRLTRGNTMGRRWPRARWLLAAIVVGSVAVTGTAAALLWAQARSTVGLEPTTALMPRVVSASVSRARATLAGPILEAPFRRAAPATASDGAQAGEPASGRESSVVERGASPLDARGGVQRPRRRGATEAAERARREPRGGAEPISLQRETSLIARAQAALRRGRPTEALAALEAYDREVGAGVLREERSALRILALCGVGRPARARAEAIQFDKRWPQSPQAARVQASCARPEAPPSGL